MESWARPRAGQTESKVAQISFAAAPACALPTASVLPAASLLPPQSAASALPEKAFDCRSTTSSASRSSKALRDSATAEQRVQQLFAEMAQAQQAFAASMTLFQTRLQEEVKCLMQSQGELESSPTPRLVASGKSAEQQTGPLSSALYYSDEGPEHVAATGPSSGVDQAVASALAPLLDAVGERIQRRCIAAITAALSPLQATLDSCNADVAALKGRVSLNTQASPFSSDGNRAAVSFGLTSSREDAATASCRSSTTGGGEERPQHVIEATMENLMSPQAASQQPLHARRTTSSRASSRRSTWAAPRGTASLLSVADLDLDS